MFWVADEVDKNTETVPSVVFSLHDMRKWIFFWVIGNDYVNGLINFKSV